MAGCHIPHMDPSMLICAYENRPAHEPAVRLLVQSLFLNDPDARLRLYFTAATPAFADWARGYPGLDLRPADLGADLGWNIKPTVLLAALDDGAAAAIWIDADIVVTRAIGPLFDGLDPAILVAAEEALWGNRDDRGARRTRLWAMPVGRVLPFTLNSCVLRVTPQHRDLLLRWQALLQSPAYRAAQQAPWGSRPSHMMGDQDVLTALLGSTAFAAIPLRILRRGRDILQLFGPLAFTSAERLRVAVAGLPPFLHAQGALPWQNDPGESGLRRAYRLSLPYARHAQRLGMAPRARILPGAALALVYDLLRPVRAAARLARRISGSSSR